MIRLTRLREQSGLDVTCLREEANSIRDAGRACPDPPGGVTSDKLADLLDQLADRLEGMSIQPKQLQIIQDVIDGVCSDISQLMLEFAGLETSPADDVPPGDCSRWLSSIAGLINLLDTEITNILRAVEVDAPAEQLVKVLLARLLVGRLGAVAQLFSSARGAVQAAAGALVATFSGLISEQSAQGASPEEIVAEIEETEEFKGFVAPLEGLSSVCGEFQPELGEMVQQLNQPGPTRPVEACDLAERIVDRVMTAIEKAESAIGADLPLPEDAVLRALSGCEAEVRQVMDACGEI